MSTSVSPVSHTNPLEPTSPMQHVGRRALGFLSPRGEGSVQPTLRWTGREGCLCPHTARAGSSRVSVRDPSKTPTLANASAGYGGPVGQSEGPPCKGHRSSAASFGPLFTQTCKAPDLLQESHRQLHPEVVSWSDTESIAKSRTGSGKSCPLPSRCLGLHRLLPFP